MNLWSSVHTFYPPSSVNAWFYRYSKLQLHGLEESQNRGRWNETGLKWRATPAQKAAH